MQIFAAHDVDLRHLDTQRVSYPPKDIHAEAIQATPENIGKLALEFEIELNYSHEGGLPFFVFRAVRGLGLEDEPAPAPKVLTVRLSDWIVPLWGELHVYRDDTFVNTFSFDDAPSHAVAFHSYKQIGEDKGQVTGKVEGPNGTGIMPAVEKTS